MYCGAKHIKMDLSSYFIVMFFWSLVATKIDIFKWKYRFGEICCQMTPSSAIGDALTDLCLFEVQ